MQQQPTPAPSSSGPKPQDTSGLWLFVGFAIVIALIILADIWFF